MVMAKKYSIGQIVHTLEYLAPLIDEAPSESPGYSSSDLAIVEIRYGVRCNEWKPERARQTTDVRALSYSLNGCTSIALEYRCWSKDLKQWLENPNGE